MVGQNNGAQLWDLEDGRPIGQPFPDDALGYVSPSFDGRFVATGLGDYVLIWNLDTDGWFDIACQAAGRNPTADEWKQFGPGDEPYRATCEQWPATG